MAVGSIEWRKHVCCKSLPNAASRTSPSARYCSGARGFGIMKTTNRFSVRCFQAMQQREIEATAFA